MKTLALAVTLALMAPAQLAWAKAERTVTQRFERVWSAALRHLRIDEGHKIVDKDAEAGYVVFTVKDKDKEFRGALELVRFKDNDDRDKIRLVLQIEDRPTYMESGLLNRMVQKLRTEARNDEAPPPARSEEEPPSEDS